MLSLASPGDTLHLCGVFSKSTLGAERGGTCAVSRRPPHPRLPRHTWWPNKPLRGRPQPVQRSEPFTGPIGGACAAPELRASVRHVCPPSMLRLPQLHPQLQLVVFLGSLADLQVQC